MPAKKEQACIQEDQMVFYGICQEDASVVIYYA